jgi:hypothetical protein
VIGLSLTSIRGLLAKSKWRGSLGGCRRHFPLQMKLLPASGI